jgi:hypothetical protein
MNKVNRIKLNKYLIIGGTYGCSYFRLFGSADNKNDIIEVKKKLYKKHPEGISFIIEKFSNIMNKKYHWTDSLYSIQRDIAELFKIDLDYIEPGIKLPLIKLDKK